MPLLVPGQNTSLPAPVVMARVTGAVDLTALVVSPDGKVAGDADMVFFNHPRGPGLVLAGDTLTVQLDGLRNGADKVVLVASPADDGKTFGEIGAVTLTISTPVEEVATFTPPGLAAERALILAEVYARGGAWKVRAVGQGYASGLAGVATDFGVEIDATAPSATATPAPSGSASTPPSSPAPRVSIEKRRLVNLEKKLGETNQEMLSLVKKAGVSLEKRGLAEHTARVALCLDISASMKRLYKDGAVQRLAERVLALALRFDDDGEVDVFLFGANAHRAPGMNLANCRTYCKQLLERHKLEGGTYYGKALRLVREHYFGSSSQRQAPHQDRLPVYLMFITDGATMDKNESIKQVRWSSYEPLFIQFMGIGEDSQPGPPKRKGLLASVLAANFDFLHKLDDLEGRFIDNANFFAVSQAQLLGSVPIPDDELFERMMGEYPGWIPQAKARGLLP